MKFRPAALFRATLLLSAVALLPATTAGLSAVDGQSGPAFARLFRVYDLVKADYVDQTDDDKLVTGAINGMLASLDPHSAYEEGASLQRLQTMMAGSYTGIGAEVLMEDGGVKVVSPMRGSPAEKAGVKAGDFITHINGKLIFGTDLDAAVAQMRGPAGTSIKLTLYRPGRDDRFDVVVTRGVISLQPVTSELHGTIGMISVNQFSHDVGRDVLAALIDLRQKSAGRLSGIVLDLRENPGGELDEAVALSDLFLTHGTIVSQRGRLPEENQTYRAETAFIGDAARGLPVVVLIDAGSASASEIVAGALQDQHRALLMGERSFGKGSVQSMIPIDATHSLKLTTARYYTPSGRSVQEGGIQPDIRVPQLTDPDARKRAEETIRESDLKGHLVNDAGLSDNDLEDDRRADPRFRMTADELKAKGIKDFQLWYAEQTLNHAAGTPAVPVTAAR